MPIVTDPIHVVHAIWHNQEIPDARLTTWQNWLPEVFADLIGLQLGGPAFAEMRLDDLMVPPSAIDALNPKKEHPSNYYSDQIEALMEERAKNLGQSVCLWRGRGQPGQKVACRLSVRLSVPQALWNG
jgi:hypothetical protein